jgi:hypothetical protein
MNKKIKQFVFFACVTYLVLLPAMIYMFTIKLLNGGPYLFLLFVIPMYFLAIPYSLANIKSMTMYGRPMADVEFSQKDPKTGSDIVVFKNFQRGFIYTLVILTASYLGVAYLWSGSYLISSIGFIIALASSVSHYRHLIKLKYMGK